MEENRSWPYHVFLSFRGVACRHSFASYLYDALLRPGFQALPDGEEIRRGEKIAVSTPPSNLRSLAPLIHELSELEQNIQLSTQELNTKNKYGFINLDVAMKDLTMEKFLRQAGAMRGRDLVVQKLYVNNHEDLLQIGNRRRWLSPRKDIKSVAGFYPSTLITVTLFATMTFHAALRPPKGYPKVTEKENAASTDLFVMFNSTAFFSLMVMITILTHELPLQPWLLATVFTTIGAYVCAIMVITPHLVMGVILVGGLILLAACLKFLALHNMVLSCLQWLRAGIRSEAKTSTCAASLPLMEDVC